MDQRKNLNTKRATSHTKDSENDGQASLSEKPSKRFHSKLDAILKEESLIPNAIIPKGKARINKIYITPTAGAKMQRVTAVNAITNRGLK